MKYLSALIFSLTIYTPQISAFEKLLLTGSSTVAPVAMELAKEFSKLNPNIKVEVQTGGSTRGIVDASRGLSSIGMVSRSLNKREKLFSYTIARDGIGIVINSENTLNGLSREQLISIYLKKITNWSELGAKEGRINVVSKAAGRSTLELFLKYTGLKNRMLKPDIIIGDNEHAIKVVTNDLNAIAYVSIGSAEYHQTKEAKLKLIKLDNIISSTKSVEKGEFPITRPLNFVTKNKPAGAIKKFIDFALSKNAIPIIKEQNFVPLSR